MCRRSNVSMMYIIIMVEVDNIYDRALTLLTWLLDR